MQPGRSLKMAFEEDAHTLRATIRSYPVPWHASCSSGRCPLRSSDRRGSDILHVRLVRGHKPAIDRAKPFPPYGRISVSARDGRDGSLRRIVHRSVAFHRPASQIAVFDICYNKWGHL